MESKPTLVAAETPSRRGKGKQVETKPASVPRGTRVSRRNRDTEDEWQQVPEEWLGNGASGSKKSNGVKRKKPVDDDDESELSELTDEEEHDAALAGNGTSVAIEEEDGTMNVDEVSTSTSANDLS